jgi:hypothetical protein
VFSNSSVGIGITALGLHEFTQPQGGDPYLHTTDGEHLLIAYISYLH